MPVDSPFVWLLPATSPESARGRSWGKCKSCGAPIFWCTTAKNQKPIPFDCVPEVIERGGFGNEKVDASQVHWKTCPEADKFRRTAPAADRSRREVAAGATDDDVF